MADAATVQELLPFLASSRADVRALALQGLLPLTAADSPARVLLFDPALLKRLREISMIDQPTSAHEAIKALINLTSEPRVLRDIAADPAYLRWIVEAILSPNSILSDPFAMLLSNLTKLDNVGAAVCTMRIPILSPIEGDGTAVDALVDVFVRGDVQQVNKYASFHFLASVLANLSTTPMGRAALLKGTTARNATVSCSLSRLAVFTEHPDTIRRGGVASIVKNCCFEKQAHLEIASEDHWNVLPRILLPLCGPEEFDIEDLETLPEECQLLPAEKRRESDPHIRLVHVESLLLLCTSLTGRAQLRRRNVYRIVQMLHKVEKDIHIREAVERLVQFLQRDEGTETKIEEVSETGQQDEDFSVQEV